MSPRLLRPRASGGFRYPTLRSGLVAYWPLNESAASGDVTAVDNSGRGNDLTSNNTVPSIAGKVNNARQFTAANTEWLSIASRADVQFGNGDWSISWWMFPQATATGFQHVMGKDESGGREVSFRVQFDSVGSANRVDVNIFHTDGTFITATAPANRTNASFINQWWHYTLVNNAGAVTLYENGTSVATATRAGGKSFAATSTQFNIGRRSFSGFLEYFTGYVDEVAKWTRALSQAEVTALYNAGSGVDLSARLSASPPAAPAGPITAQYLIAAGGGGGGGFGNNPQFGGGGGGGGVLSGSQSLSSGQTYTVTVGGGGAGGGTAVARGTNGANSVFSSLAANGGGGGGIGGGALSSGLSGGCGGGGGSNYAGAPTRFIGAAGTGTAGQGNDGGRGHHDNDYETVAAGGGGGAGAAGADGTRFGSGKGGDGALSSITGTATRYAGGGAALGDNANGGAGLGGGGNRDTAGSANTGGGGGAASGPAGYGLGAAGGSGVVIIRLPVAAASTIGSPTVTTSGGDTIYTFTGSGSITI